MPAARRQPSSSGERRLPAAAFSLWFFGFIVVGGEWFQMWQSANWNGQPSAFRVSACIALVLIALLLPERDPPR